MAEKKIICPYWTYSRREKSLQSLIRVILAVSNDIWNVVHVKVFFHFFNFELSNLNSLCHLKSLKRLGQIEVFFRHYKILVSSSPGLYFEIKSKSLKPSNRWSNLSGYIDFDKSGTILLKII